MYHRLVCFLISSGSFSDTKIFCDMQRRRLELLCFVDHASLYNLVNKANLVHSLFLRKILHQVGFIYKINFNPLNAELHPICHLVALLGAHPILHVSRVRVNVCSHPHLGSFPHVCSPNPCVHLSCPPYALHAPQISFFI